MSYNIENIKEIMILKIKSGNIVQTFNIHEVEFIHTGFIKELVITGNNLHIDIRINPYKSMAYYKEVFEEDVVYGYVKHERCLELEEFEIIHDDYILHYDYKSGINIIIDNA